MGETATRWRAVVWREAGAFGAATLYFLFCFGVLFAEELLHAYRASSGLADAVTALWAHRNRNVILAKAICVGLTFAGYHLYTGIDRQLGEGTLRRALGRPAGAAEPGKERRHGRP